VDLYWKGGTPKPGPQSGRRRVAEPVGGKTTLLEPPLGPYAPYLEKLDKKREEERMKKEEELKAKGIHTPQPTATPPPPPPPPIPRPKMSQQQSM
jgi:hypothetical protein